MQMTPGGSGGAVLLLLLLLLRVVHPKNHVFGPVFGPRRVPAAAAGSGRIVRDARADRAAFARALRRFHRVSSR